MCLVFRCGDKIPVLLLFLSVSKSHSCCRIVNWALDTPPDLADCCKHLGTSRKQDADGLSSALDGSVLPASNKEHNNDNWKQD